MNPTTFKKRIRLKGFDYRGCFRYFLTFCARDRQRYFTDSITVQNIAHLLKSTAIKYEFKIWSVCFMPDHLHVLVEGTDSSSDMRKFAAAFKQASGYWFRRDFINVGQGFSLANQTTLKGCPTQVKRQKDLWQVNYYEHVLRSDEATEKVARYILDNPIRKGLAADYREYPFAWCQALDFVGQGFGLAKSGNPEGLPYEGLKATLKGCPAKNKKNGAGFTLIELVITIVLLSIISGIAAMIILQGVKAYSDEHSRSDVHYQAKLAVERIAREARMIRSCGDITLPVGNPFNTLTFTEIDGTAVTFDAATGNLTLGGNILAKNVSANPFTFLDRSGNPSITCVTPNDIWYLQIDLTDTQGSETLEIRTCVHPMNF